jgi:hypothetical protein
LFLTQTINNGKAMQYNATSADTKGTINHPTVKTLLAIMIISINVTGSHNKSNNDTNVIS